LNVKKAVDTASLDSPLDSPLTELTSSDDDENDPPLKKEKEEVDLPGRPKRGVVKRAQSQKSSSQGSGRDGEDGGSQRSRSGRLVRGRR